MTVSRPVQIGLARWSQVMWGLMIAALLLVTVMKVIDALKIGDGAAVLLALAPFAALSLVAVGFIAWAGWYVRYLRRQPDCAVR